MGVPVKLPSHTHPGVLSPPPPETLWYAAGLSTVALSYDTRWWARLRGPLQICSRGGRDGRLGLPNLLRYNSGRWNKLHIHQRAVMS